MYRLASSERYYFYQLGLIQEHLMEPLQKTGKNDIDSSLSFSFPIISSTVIVICTETANFVAIFLVIQYKPYLACFRFFSYPFMSWDSTFIALENFEIV